MTQKDVERVWVVVEVESGVVTTVEVYRHQYLAKMREQFLLSTANPMDDDVVVFSEPIWETLPSTSNFYPN